MGNMNEYIDDSHPCMQPDEKKVLKLEEENNKLHEEVKLLHNKLIEYTNIIKHIEYSVKLSVGQISNDDYLDFLAK